MVKQHDPISLSDEQNSRGIELADRGWLDEAVKAFKKAIDLDPQSAHAHDNLATVYAEQGEYLEAIECYLQALRIEPDSPTAHYNLGCFLASHSHNMAIDEYKQAIDADPDYPDAHINLGLTYADLGRFDEARESYNAALAINPDDSTARYELARVDIDTGQHQDAIPKLRMVLNSEADHLDALIDLGLCFTVKGFYDEAGKTLARALEIAPEDALANYYRAVLAAVSGDIEEALTHLDIALAGDPERVRVWASGDPFFESLRLDARFVEIMERPREPPETDEA